MTGRPHVLPDVLAPGLRVVFCGSAAGRVSAERGAYYAGPGNRFWPILFEVALTPRLLRPEEFPSVLCYGIGLTDVTKNQFGEDRLIRRGAGDAAALRRKIERFRPAVLAFVGKAAARAALGHREIAFGAQADRIADTDLFVLPSPSGAARGFWDPRWWRTLAERVNAKP